MGATVSRRYAMEDLGRVTPLVFRVAVAAARMSSSDAERGRP